MQATADALAGGMPGADEDYSRALKPWLALAATWTNGPARSRPGWA